MVEQNDAVGFVCTGCHAYARHPGACQICGSTVVVATTALGAEQSRDLATDIDVSSRPHRLALVVGLTGVVASLVSGLLVLVMADAGLALTGAIGCALGSIPLLFRWRSTDATDLFSASRSTMRAGVTIWASIVVIVPGPARGGRLITVALGVVGFLVLQNRHAARAVEASGFDSRGVPM